MKYEEIKVLSNTNSNKETITEKETNPMDIDTLIEIEWRKRERLQCLA